MLDLVRQSPSGPRVAPVNAQGFAAWDAAAPVTFVLAPAGHDPGVYSYTIALWTTTNPTAGTVTIAVNYTAPGLGAVSQTITAGLALINGVFIAPRHLMSSGVGAITLTLTPAGVTGSPRVYVNMPPVDFMLALFPAGFP